jgi:hypothetical protein
MADPLSLAASAVALLGAGSTCATLLFDLVLTLHKAPEELLALSNEVNELKSVLQDITDICGAIDADDSSTASARSKIKNLLARAREALKKLDDLLKEPSERWTWIRKKARANKLRGQLKDIRKDLNESLALFRTRAT